MNYKFALRTDTPKYYEHKGDNMTNQRFFETAIRQSARDVGCRPEDFLLRENSFFASVRRKGAKVFYPETSDFFAVRYGLGNAVAVRADKLGEVSEALRDSDLICPAV